MRGSLDNSIYSAFGPYVERLRTDPLVVLALLRLVSTDTARMVFDLLGYSIHVSRLGAVPGSAAMVDRLVRMRLVSTDNSVVALLPDVRAALLKAFCMLSHSRRFVLQDGGALSSASASTTGSAPTHVVAGTGTGTGTSASTSTTTPSSTSTASSASVGGGFQDILNQVVSRDAPHSPAAHALLLYAGYIDSFGDITSRGFELLLSSRQDQLWLLILHAIRKHAPDTEAAAALFRTMMELCLVPDGAMVVEADPLQADAAATAALFDTTWPALFDTLASFGIIAPLSRRGATVRRFRVSTAPLLFCSSDRTRPPLVVETNFKLYAYVTSAYEKSLLGLFSRTVYTLPNLVKAQIDEDAIGTAFERHITAAQIIRYLKDNTDYLPANIENQIIIWEQKLHRIQTRKGVLFMDFNHLSDYISLCNFLLARRALLFKDETQRILIAEESVYEKAKEHLQAQA